jgi:hypothetical protein
MTLLFPRIAMHVIAIALPEAGLVALQQFNGFEPLRALPCVEPGNNQACRAAVVETQRLSIVRDRNKRVFSQEIRQWNVGRKSSVMAVRENESRLWTRAACQRDNITRLYPFPQVPQTAPAGDAVKIRKHAHAGQLREFTPVPFRHVANHAVNFELPRIEIDAGRAAGVEHRPFFRARLSGWNPLRPTGVGTDDRPRRRVNGG